MNTVNMTSCKSQIYWELSSLIQSSTVDFKLMNYLTDKGAKESVAVLTSNGSVFFKDHFKYIQNSQNSAQYSSFSISKDLNYLIVTGTGNNKFLFHLYKLDKKTKTFHHVHFIQLDTQPNF